ncbi:class F sortase [Streptomyces avicenniae]|uniref:class F sortase n=1 Tax=Streptomyces avicenniae TaxID=500153 RepID=UPI00069AE9FA|nr:class F sortase [Streptomyces avicenniae]
MTPPPPAGTLPGRRTTGADTAARPPAGPGVAAKAAKAAPKAGKPAPKAAKPGGPVKAAKPAKPDVPRKKVDLSKKKRVDLSKKPKDAPAPVAPEPVAEPVAVTAAPSGRKKDEAPPRAARPEGGVPVLAGTSSSRRKAGGRAWYGRRRKAAPTAPTATAPQAKRGPRHAAGQATKQTAAASDGRNRPGRHRKAGATPASTPAPATTPAASGAGRHRKAGPAGGRKTADAKPAEAAPRPSSAKPPTAQAAKAARTAKTAEPASDGRTAGKRRRRSAPAVLFLVLQILLLGLPGLVRGLAFRVAPRLARRFWQVALALRIVRLVRRRWPAVRKRAKAVAKARRARRARRPSGKRSTRHQRLALRTRRWETAAAVATVTAALAAGLVATGRDDGVREARASSDIADGVSRPGAVDAPGAAPNAGSTADLGAVGQPSAFVAPPLIRSSPARIRIPQLGTDVEVFGAALGTDGGPPSPAEEDAMRAAWYSGGVSPGEQGAAILVGHLDTYTGPAAFAGLGQLRPGENIEIDREDGQTAVFTVDSVEQYPKSDFPDERVYGAVGTPQLRLITCGGRWTEDGGYDSNIVAYARLTGTLPSPGTAPSSDSSQEQAGVPGVNGA